jgi:hypothetical protein
MSNESKNHPADDAKSSAMNAELAHALGLLDPEVRAWRILHSEAWRDTLNSLPRTGTYIGRTNPVSGYPRWGTRGPAESRRGHRGLLAGGPLQPDELELLSELPSSGERATERERLNNYFLTDAGLARLRAALRSGAFRIEMAEQAALPAVAILLERGAAREAAEIVHEITLFLPGLRFYPALTQARHVTLPLIQRERHLDVADKLSSKMPNGRVARMNATVAVFNPLCDELVSLWLETALPAAAANRLGSLGSSWPPGWNTRRASWLTRYEMAVREHGAVGRHHHRKSTFQKLLKWLEMCPGVDHTITHRDLLSLRAIVQEHLDRHGTPEAAANGLGPTLDRVPHSEVAHAVGRWIQQVDRPLTVADLEGLASPALDGITPDLPAGSELPTHIRAKAGMALRANLQTLFSEGVVPSLETLVPYLPLLNSQVVAARHHDPVVKNVFRQSHAAHWHWLTLHRRPVGYQTPLDSLPWLRALNDEGDDTVETRRLAFKSLRDITMFCFRHFPQARIPNGVLPELENLAVQSGTKLTLVSEIEVESTGQSFHPTHTAAGCVAILLLQGTFYSGYFGLSEWAQDVPHHLPDVLDAERFKGLEDAFKNRCRIRAEESGTADVSHQQLWDHTTAIEQAEILTTDNLATLVFGLDLTDALRENGATYGSKALFWCIQEMRSSRALRRHRERKGRHYGAYRKLAIAWRQAIFFLSFAPGEEVRQIVGAFQKRVSEHADPSVRRLSCFAAGLQMVLDGGKFDSLGFGPNGERRLLGRTVGSHPLDTGEVPDRKE